MHTGSNKIRATTHALHGITWATMIKRRTLLTGILMVATAAWIYDYTLARRGVEITYQKIGEFVDAANRVGVKKAAIVTAADIHQAIGMQPTWVDRHATEQYEVEYYCWWGRVPFVGMRRHYLAVVYVGEAPQHFSSHYQNEQPPQEALPMPIRVERADAAVVDADETGLPLKDRRHLRRPVAAAWIEKEKLLAVANQRSGSISIVDFSKRQVLEEIAVGEHLADIAADPLGRWLIAVDEAKHAMIVLERENDSLRVAARHRVSPYPVSVAVSPNGERISVASLWSRKLTVFECSGDSSSVTREREISLPFNPREQRFSSAESVLVEDAFANRCSEINIRDQTSTYRSETLSSNANSYEHVKGLDGRYGIHKGQERIADSKATITLGPVPPLTPEERGEELFYTLQSAAGQSCHTCHVHGHTNYELADTLGDGTTDTPKRILTLLGTRATYPWAWNGKVGELDDQVRLSLETTLHLPNVTDRQVIDINAFLLTLKPPPPLQPASDDPADCAQLERGKLLFDTLGCVKCHMPQFVYTSPDVFDVGLRDEKGMSKFNPPSLLGVSQGYSFFHDGRAKTLAEVFSVHGYQLPRALLDDELADLLRYLRSL